MSKATETTPTKRRIRINRTCLGGLQNEVKTDLESNSELKTVLKDNGSLNAACKATDDKNDPPPRKKTKEESTASGSVVDNLFKDFLAQKMALIEEERAQIEKNTEKRRKKNVASEQEQLAKGPTPFREFLMKKMSEIEEERKKAELDEGKKTEKCENTKQIQHSMKELEKEKPLSKVPEKEKCVATKPASKETLAEKMAAIEKETREAEQKAIQIAKDNSDMPTKTKIHKKDRKRDKERSYRKRSRTSESRSRSRSRSRDSPREKKKKRKSKHKVKSKDREKDREKGKDRSRSKEKERKVEITSDKPIPKRSENTNSDQKNTPVPVEKSSEEQSESKTVKIMDETPVIVKSSESTIEKTVPDTPIEKPIEPTNEGVITNTEVTNTPANRDTLVKEKVNALVEENQKLLREKENLIKELEEAERIHALKKAGKSENKKEPSESHKKEAGDKHKKDKEESVKADVKVSEIKVLHQEVERKISKGTDNQVTITFSTNDNIPPGGAEGKKDTDLKLPGDFPLMKKSTEESDDLTTAPLLKVPAEGTQKKTSPLKLGIKISQMSAELIQSGRRVDIEGKPQLEEGELDESEEGTGSVSTDFTSDVSETETMGSNTSLKKKKKKKSKHKKKKKKHKGEKKDKGTPRKKRHSRSRSRSRSRSYDRGSRSRSRERSRRRSRSLSKERDRSRRGGATGFWRDADRYRPRFWQGGRGGYQGRKGRWSRSRSRSRSRERKSRNEEDLRLKIDKAKLREIAIANAYANMQTGQGPPVALKPDDIAAIKSGGKSVEELTDFCKRIAHKEGETSSSSDSDGMGKNSDDEAEGPFIHHPFKVREATNIVMNIRNAKQLPTLTPAEKIAQTSHLRLTFPVSSGSHHRDKEDEWVPVEKPQPASSSTTDKKTSDKEKTTPVSKATSSSATTSTATVTTTTTTQASPIPALPPPPPPPPLPQTSGVFPEPPQQPINISAIVSERLSAMRKLQDNPNDVVAIGTMYKAQQQMNQWAQSKQLPGQFTGSTGVQVLSQQELSGPDKKLQAWIKKDQFTKAAPVKSGIGMYLLQKMGWKQGEGLGKNKEGSTEPLLLDFKTDRKGLTSTGETLRKNPPPPAVKDLQGKHPVSALVELCTKRRWGSPDFVIVHESGPDHRKNFLYKVVVNGQEFQASVASTNKKQAKAQAATVCLQELGLVPLNAPPPPV